ncbi:MAG: RNA polymerase sigma factor [Leptospiraceae bacterium]|nr:RNA polymerase sigma factor [Leptospiraceae bacterium]
MIDSNEDYLKKAVNGDIHAFHELFSEFQNQLKSYLYRILANRNDAEDILHDTFIRGFDKLKTFRMESSLKTWIFQIATNLAYNKLSKQKRWTSDVSEKAKNIVLSNKSVYDSIMNVRENSEYAEYEIKEHIDTCFTCISKNLPIENQIALMLKDVYGFSIEDVCSILEKSEGVVKYLLVVARKTMIQIFDDRCVLVNKKGICNQCSELNGWFNPKQNQQEELMKLDLVKESTKYDKEKLLELRTKLVKEIDPLKTSGHELQEILLKCNRMAMGEVSIT